MITLITGTPGTGKTAWVLAELLKLRAAEPNRELYIHGIRNLRGIAHETIYCKSQLCDICRSKDIPEDAKYVENWPEWKTSGSLIIVDEVQRIWRPRTGGNPPESVSGLETHRHYGIDFWLISQGPHLFDNFIRLLVGKHVHLVAKWNGRSQYEWPECQQNVTSRTDAIMRPYTLPKHVYKMYDSAELHTKQNKRVPLSLYVFGVAILAAVYLFWNVYVSISNRIDPPPPVAAGVGAVANGAAGAGVSFTPSIVDIKPSSSLNISGHVQLFPDFKPRVAGVPESAPAYSGLVKVQQAPLLAGCIKTKTDCKCYTQQATPYPSTAAYCAEVVAGHRFNPYLERKQAAAPSYNVKADKSDNEEEKHT
jgi:zona occludens toxin